MTNTKRDGDVHITTSELKRLLALAKHEAREATLAEVKARGDMKKHLDDEQLKIGVVVSARVGRTLVRGKVTDVFRSPTSKRAVYEISTNLKKALGLKPAGELFPAGLTSES